MWADSKDGYPQKHTHGKTIVNFSCEANTIFLHFDDGTIVRIVSIPKKVNNNHYEPGLMFTAYDKTGKTIPR